VRERSSKLIFPSSPLDHSFVDNIEFSLLYDDKLNILNFDVTTIQMPHEYFQNFTPSVQSSSVVVVVQDCN
jgi:hypothetical protein